MLTSRYIARILTYILTRLGANEYHRCMQTLAMEMSLRAAQAKPRPLAGNWTRRRTGEGARQQACTGAHARYARKSAACALCPEFQLMRTRSQQAVARASDQFLDGRGPCYVLG